MALLTVTEKKPVLGFDQKVRTTVSDVKGRGVYYGESSRCGAGSEAVWKAAGPVPGAGPR